MSYDISFKVKAEGVDAYCEPDSYCSHGRRKEETKHAAD